MNSSNGRIQMAKHSLESELRRSLRGRHRTEEQKMKLNVDLRCIPEWEAELKAMRESIHNRFQLFSLPDILAAATTICSYSHLDFKYGYSQNGGFEEWKNTLTVDKLIDFSKDFTAPNCLRNRPALIEIIRNGLKQAEDFLLEFKAKGVTNSFLVSMVTSKVEARTVHMWEQEKSKYLALSREIPKIESALNLLEKVYSLSAEYNARVSELKEKLALAEEKRAAIERFEKMHGKALAKGAAADNKSRQRVASLKSLVKKTKECPYCGSDLGGDPHLDHIYPVTKGGLSIVENLVWCCSTCNGLKSDKGLMQFLKEQGLPIEQTLTRLHSLGKHV